jgi:hypothetical protein
VQIFPFRYGTSHTTKVNDSRFAREQTYFTCTASGYAFQHWKSFPKPSHCAVSKANTVKVALQCWVSGLRTFTTKELKQCSTIVSIDAQIRIWRLCVALSFDRLLPSSRNQWDKMMMIILSVVSPCYPVLYCQVYCCGGH